MSHNILRGPSISTDNLEFAFDAASKSSYVGSGSVIHGLASGVDAELVNTVSFVSDNRGYFNLDGLDDYIACNKIDLSDTKAVTVGLMIKAGSSTNAQMIAEFSTNYGSNTDGFFCSYQDSIFGYSKDIMVGTKGNKGRNIVAFSKSILSDQQWKYICLVYDRSPDSPISTRCKLYVNSVQQLASQAHSPNWRSDNTNNFGNNGLFVGARYGGVAPFLGSVACCHVYRKALSTKEMYTNYTAIKTRFGL